LAVATGGGHRIPLQATVSIGGAPHHVSHSVTADFRVTCRGCRACVGEEGRRKAKGADVTPTIHTEQLEQSVVVAAARKAPTFRVQTAIQSVGRSLTQAGWEHCTHTQRLRSWVQNAEQHKHEHPPVQPVLMALDSRISHLLLEKKLPSPVHVLTMEVWRSQDVPASIASIAPSHRAGELPGCAAPTT
jgi:hypothetical protein